jgi:phosphoglycolate phosphatase-like HAD superfamily hydrolase
MEHRENHFGRFDAQASLFVGDRPEDQECAKRINVPFQWAWEWRGEVRS